MVFLVPEITTLKCHQAHNGGNLCRMNDAVRPETIVDERRRLAGRATFVDEWRSATGIGRRGDLEDLRAIDESDAVGSSRRRR